MNKNDTAAMAREKAKAMLADLNTGDPDMLLGAIDLLRDHLLTCAKHEGLSADISAEFEEAMGINGAMNMLLEKLDTGEIVYSLFALDILRNHVLARARSQQRPMH